MRWALLVAVGWCLDTVTRAAEFPKPTPEQRRAYISRARVWEEGDVAAKDLFAGPPGRLPFGPGDEVTCDFVPKQMTGWTEKFACRVSDGTVVKVKYLGPSAYKEAFGEVLGTRLLWALGFYADRMIPVHVICRGCPLHPWEYVNVMKRLPLDEAGLIRELPHEALPGTYRFDVAAIEEPLDGETIEVEDQQGWAWDELEGVDASVGGATRAEKDALKLFMAFVKNSDNKAKQNTLLCPRAEIDGAGCRRPVLLVDDLGSVFGEGGVTTGGSGRIDYDGWKSRRVWKDEKKCRARLSAVAGILRSSTLKDPVVGEGGRKLLAEQLEKLSDEQIADLFRVARVEELAQTTRDGAAQPERMVTIDDWLALFKEKRREITEHPGCPNP